MTSKNSRSTEDSADAPRRTSGERLQKLLSRAGIASRRAAEDIIASGRVTVDGQVVTEPGARADATASVVAVDGRPIVPDSPRRYLLLYKPAGYVTTVSDTHGRPTVLDLLSDERAGLYPVGRLDLETEGLLLLTDDGELANSLTHPKYHVPKDYEATVRGVPDADDLAALTAGVELEEGRTAPALARIVCETVDGAVVRITLYEGRKRQVRRMLDAIGHPVRHLVRVGLGPLTLAGLEKGEYRQITDAELSRLRDTSSRS